MLARNLLFLALLGSATLLHAEPLTFDAALNVAERESPDLAAQGAGIASARAAARAAGALPDLRLALGVDNLPVTGPDRWSLNRDFMTMRKVGLMQEIPNTGRRRASVDEADAMIAQAEAERRVHIAAVRSSAAVAWINVRYAELRVSLLGELHGENDLVASQVQSQLLANRGVATDAVLPGQEAADLADRLDEGRAELAQARAALRRLLGPAGDEPLAGESPNLTADASQLRLHVHAHPELVAFGPMIAGAQAKIHAAEAAARPDWGVELAYAHRAALYSDMVSLQVTVALPVFRGSRQDPLIDASHRALQRLEAERADMLRDHTEALDARLAELESMNSRLDRATAQRLPLAQQKVQLALASYQSNHGDLASVLAARREWIDTRLAELQLRNQRDALAATLHYTYEEAAP
jgi:outer membrane protein TolC